MLQPYVPCIDQLCEELHNHFFSRDIECRWLIHSTSPTRPVQPHAIAAAVAMYVCLLLWSRYVPIMTSRVYWHRIRYGSVVLAKGEDEEISQSKPSRVSKTSVAVKCAIIGVPRTGCILKPSG